jgi:hypothetical protein
VVLVLLAAAVAVVAVAGFLVLRPGGAGEPAAAGSDTSDPAVSAQGAAASSTAPYTVEEEPSEVATDAPSETTGGRVQVVLTYAMFDAASGTVQGNGFAAGVIEEGGTCTLTLTRGDDEVTATTTAVADASTSTCGLLETGTGLETGTWDAVLTYSSDRARGESEAMEVTVP